MRRGGDWQLIAMCVVVAAVSAVCVTAFDRQDAVEIARALSDTPATEPPAKLSGRLPGINTEVVALKELPLETPPKTDGLSGAASPESEWQVEASAESENPDTWPVDVQRDPATPAAPTSTGAHVTGPPPVTKLPWQAAPTARGPLSKRMSERLAEISPAASTRLMEKFVTAKAAWPPSEMALVSFKDEKILELFTRSNGSAWQSIHRYPVLAASGKTGPKLRKGDRQVPEGVYGISFLNPDSRYHVSLRVNYPNSFDRAMAEKEGRKELGGDIMIHGKNVSAGCLAIGDTAAEEVFVLAAQTGTDRIKVVIAPTDLRRNTAPSLEPGQPQWLPKLYGDVAVALAEFPKPQSSGLLSFFSKFGK